MSVTRAQLEKLIVKRCGKLMDAVDFDLTYTGVNDDLNDPIAWAVRRNGGTVSNPISVSDADIATLADSKLDALIDLAEYRTLINVKGNYALVDIQAGPEKENLSQTVANLEQLLARKWQYIQDTYGIGSPVMETALLSDDFATHGDDPELVTE